MRNMFFGNFLLGGGTCINREPLGRFEITNTVLLGRILCL